MGSIEPEIRVTERDGAARFEAFVKPRASVSRLVAVRSGAVALAVAAPPVEGAANEAVVDLVATVLEVARRDVRIVSGASSRTKVVEVRGLGAAAVVERLRRALAP